MGWATAHPPDPAGVATCIQCGLCLPSCPTFRLTGREDQSPRGRITAMAAVADGAELDGTVAEMLDTCLGCRACEAACPSLVPYGELIEAARVETSQVSGSKARSSLLANVLPSKGLLGTATLGARVAQGFGSWVVPGKLRTGFDGLRPLSGRPDRFKGGTWEPEGEPVATVGLLTGCVMDEWFRAVHEATVTVLVAAGYRVVAPEAQTCCGALSAHDGDRETAVDLATRNVPVFEGFEFIVSNSAGCGAHLEGYGHLVEGGDSVAARAVDVTELVAVSIDEGRLPSFEGVEPVAIQDPCHLRHAQRVVEEPRAVVRAAGYRPVEIDPAGICCGAAGTYSVLHPETSKALGGSKADQVRSSKAAIVASANPGCELQLRGHLGGDARVAHPVELYAESLVADGYRPGR